jgi:hypothetical protein
MSLWRPLATEFGEALLRRAGLGDYMFDPACSVCNVAYGPGVRLFRCEQCGEYLQCLDCVISNHKLNPLHCLKVSAMPSAPVDPLTYMDSGMEWSTFC